MDVRHDIKTLKAISLCNHKEDFDIDDEWFSFFLLEAIGSLLVMAWAAQ